MPVPPPPPCVNARAEMLAMGTGSICHPACQPRHHSVPHACRRDTFKENECLLTTQKHCPCIEFILAEPESGLPHRHGFHSSQLLHYRLEANDGGNGGTPQGAPEKLTIAFATADVTLTGWRLDRLADDLRDGDLLAVRALPARYAHLDKSKCAVASISVEPITNGESR